jgi:trehalose/maltose hydrolase-like predicted phosphorylase
MILQKSLLFLLSCLSVRATDNWTLDSGVIEPKQIEAKNYFGIVVGNGVLGLLSTPVPFTTECTLINGVYEMAPHGYASSLVQSFDFLELVLTLDGQKIDRLDQVANFTQRLEMKGAVLRTSFDIPGKVRVSYATRALRQFPNSALMDVTITALASLKFSVLSAFGTPTSLSEVKTRQTKAGTYAMDRKERPYLRVRGASAKTRLGRHQVGAAQAFLFEEPPAETPVVNPGEDGLSFEKSLNAGDAYRFALVGTTFTSAEINDPANQAERLTANLAVQPLNELIARHEREWSDLWRSDIIVEGDDVTQRAVRSMLYHLYSFVRADRSLSIPPMGLTNLGYGGRIFWDADLWMFPALLALHPELGRSMLDYRYDRLPAARKNALLHGYRGAKFPWESAETGDEDTHGFLAGPLQHHITADIAFAAWSYYQATQDKQWLRDKGYALLSETADFWCSRVERNGPGCYDIKNVTCADEYGEFVDNNAFTNGAARQNLIFATAAAKVLGLKPNPDWEHVRQNIPILRFPDGVTREYASYDGQQLKQADVNLLSFPFKEITDAKTIRLDLEYYGTKLDLLHGPAMAKPVFAVLYHRLGETDKAFEIFQSGYVPNRRPPFGVLAENASSRNPYFATGAGGLLQAMIYGFGGLHLADNGFVHKPTRLPAAWKSVTITGVGPEKRTYTVSGN